MNHKTRSTFLLAAVLLVSFGVAGCTLLDFPPPEAFPQESDVVDGDVDIVSVKFQVDEKDRFYTSLSHLLGRDMGGTKLHFADGIELKNTSNETRTVIVTAALQGFSLVAKQTVELAANETKKLAPINLVYDFDRLYSVTSAVEANVHLAVYQGDDLVALTTESVTIEPVNRFRWSVEGEDEPIDIRGLSAVFVIPADRGNEVQKLLNEAAQYSAWGTMHGYQGGTRESAMNQAEALYKALKARNTVYERVPDSFFDGAQSLKLPAQSLAAGAGNCFDGSLVFASAFEATGMQPFLVLMKGHALVGIRLEANNDDSTIFIETTMLSSATFEQAVNAARATVQQRVDDEDPQLATVDVAALRRVGISPLGS